VVSPVTKRVLTYTPIALFLVLDIWAFATGTYASDRDRILPFYFAAIAFLYMLPSIIACHRNHSQFLGVWLADILGTPLFLIGWFIALIWAFVDPKRNRHRLEM
jgi:hypothetical protein